MPSAADRLEFAPPQPPGMLRAFGLAVIAHVLLLVALTWGISWKRDAENLAVEAELWSSIPQQAAPKPVDVQPPPVPKVIEPPKPQPVKEAQIAVEKEKPKPEPKKPPPPKVEPKPEPPKKLAETPKPKASSPKQLAQAEAAKLEAQRQENLKRIAGLAGATGAPGATGTAQRSSGPSASYAGRISALVKRNVVFTDDIAGNPVAEVEVRASPDGTIVGRKLVKPSGIKSWDDAVIRAIDKTEVLPRDIDGRVPSPIIISFRLKD